MTEQNAIEVVHPDDQEPASSGDPVEVKGGEERNFTNADAFKADNVYLLQLPKKDEEGEEIDPVREAIDLNTRRLQASLVSMDQGSKQIENKVGATVMFLFIHSDASTAG